MHLTDHPDDAHKGIASTAKAEEAGAPVDEIEVTSAMIDAGVDCFFDGLNSECLWSSPEPFKDVVKRSFLAILRARQKSYREGPRRGSEGS
jgi:hypothetical protein